MAYHNENENAVDMCRKIRSQSLGCSGCKQTLAKSRKDLKKATRASDNRLKLANREHSHQMQKLKLETGKVIKSLQVKIRAFDKIVKGINANGQKFAQGTLLHQECHSRSSSRLNYEISGNELITQAKQRKEPKHTEENKNQEDEQQLKLLNSRMSRTESELTAKIDEWKDLSDRLQKLEERNDILHETKHQHRDLVEKLESKSLEVAVLNKKLLETENYLSAKKDEFKDLTNKLKLLESQSGVIEKQKRLLESKEEQILDLEKKLGDGEKRLADTLAKMEEQRQDLEKNIVRRSQFDERIEKAEASAQAAEDLYERLDFLEQQNENLWQSKNDFKNIVLKQQGWFESRGAQLQNLENQLQERDDMLVEASRKIDELRKELESNWAELSGMDERRAKAEATAWELMQTPLLTIDSSVMIAEYPERKRTNPRSTSLKDGRRILKKHLIPVNGLTIDKPSADTVSDMSDFEEKSIPSNSDLEEFESEPSQIFGDAHFFPEVKSGGPYPERKKGYTPSTLDSSSNFGSTISSSADELSTSNKLTLTEDPHKEKRSYSSTCSLDEQSLSKHESFTQSNVTCIKMLSSDASLSGSCSSSMFDPLISQRPEKNMEINSPTTNCVEVHKDQELSQKLGIATERQFKLNAMVATLEEELRGKDNLLKKMSQQLKKYAVELAKYKLTSKSTTKTQTPSASDVGSINVISAQEESLDRRVQKLEEELNRKNTQIAIEKGKISSLECKFQKRSQAIAKLVKKIGRLQNRLVVRDDLIATFSKRASKKSDENILRAIEIMENGLNNLFDCFKICCLDLGNKVQELQKRTVDLKHYVAESSSEGFSRQYSLKSIPIKNCIIAISKNFVKHQEEMYSFNRNFRNAVSVILRLYKRAATLGQTRSSSESKSSRFLSSSLHYHLQESSLSSIEIPAQKRRLSSLCQKNYPYFQTKVMVEDEREDSTYEKRVADIETSHSTSSLFAVFTSESGKATKVRKRYKSKKSLGHNISGSEHRSSYPDKMRGVVQVDLTPEVREVIIDEGARVVKSENSHCRSH